MAQSTIPGRVRDPVTGRSMSKSKPWVVGTAPDMTEFRCEADDGGRGVLKVWKVWNVWRDQGGIMQTWIGNSGMIISDEGSVIRLHSSDGTGEFDPTALVVELRRGE